MRVFRASLASVMGETTEPLRWVYIPYDQLNDGIGALATEPPERLGVLLIEDPEKARRRPYHRQKLALVLANQRHFALEQARRGVHVRYEVGPCAEVISHVAKEVGPLEMQRPAEHEHRTLLQPLMGTALLERPHDGWLTGSDTFRSACGKPPWRMDAFYRAVRQRTGLLMTEAGKPEGGRYSFDGENRRRWPGAPQPPEMPRFEPDEVTLEVVALIESRFAHHPGRLDATALPATREDAERLWAWAKGECLPTFGPFEDAMSRLQRTLWHTRISPLLNLHRLLPGRVVREAAGLELPLASKEGFVRQVLGWREFVHHVHEETDGLRDVADSNRLRANEPLPEAYWGTVKSGFACLDDVVESVWEEGYSHHITRLMVLSNLGTLLGLDPRALTDWFWVAYTDAYDWVVEPNVLGMGTFALGELMTTKPYVSGSAYVNRMSDYCKGCAFHPTKTCPWTSLYWAFLDRHEDRLAGNFRMSMPLRSLGKRAPERRARDRWVREQVLARLRRGSPVGPEDFEDDESGAA